ncbi:hypothetical protein AB0J82_24560 [Asanoa sp. NPDC049518]|uniref:hypothetical protein n=1 Tax=unclassified Asanoa TaxID=2685164 RepID=UPI003426127B
MKKLLSRGRLMVARILTFGAVVGGTVIATIAPAQAQSWDTCCFNIGPENFINVTSIIETSGANWDHDAFLQIGAKATSATGCKITGWLILSSSSGTWEGPRVTKDCTYSLTHRNTATRYEFWAGYSSAATGKSRVCIDLYYNNSTSSGWQRCGTSGVYYNL